MFILAKFGPGSLQYLSWLENNWLSFVFFFFRVPFSRRKSVAEDFFTGQFPGKAISIPAAPDVPSKSPVGDISVVTLKRIDTTLFVH